MRRKKKLNYSYKHKAIFEKYLRYPTTKKNKQRNFYTSIIYFEIYTKREGFKCEIKRYPVLINYWNYLYNII